MIERIFGRVVISIATVALFSSPHLFISNLVLLAAGTALVMAGWAIGPDSVIAGLLLLVLSAPFSLALLRLGQAPNGDVPEEVRS